VLPLPIKIQYFEEAINPGSLHCCTQTGDTFPPRLIWPSTV